MKPILVPTDFSACAHFATEAAIEIAKVSQAKIHFLHFVSIPIDWVNLEHNEEKMYPDVTKKVAAITEDLKKLVAQANDNNVEASYFIGYNDDTNNIINHITRHNVSMVVMGSHGASGMREFLIGSNAQKVVRNSTVPVLIIKKKIDSILIPNIVFVSDFDEESTKAFLQVLRFAELIGANVHLLYINTPGYFNETWDIQEKMESFEALASERLSRSNIYSAYVLEDGIEKYCDTLNDAIVAISTHGRRGLSRAFWGSEAEKVVNHINSPVLSLRI